MPMQIQLRHFSFTLYKWNETKRRIHGQGQGRDHGAWNRWEDNINRHYHNSYEFHKIQSSFDIPKRTKCLPFVFPGHALQHLPGNWTGSSQSSFGHSFLMFLHWTRATIRRRFVTCKEKINNEKTHSVSWNKKQKMRNKIRNVRFAVPNKRLRGKTKVILKWINCSNICHLRFEIFWYALLIYCHCCYKCYCYRWC